jgi:lactoylglutathione lyase
MKLSYLILAVVSTISAIQTSAAQTAGSIPAATFNHTAYYVVDLKTTTDFYKDIMGLQQIPEPFNDGKHSWFYLGPNMALHIISGATQTSAHIIQEHLCFSMPSIEDFIKKLKAKKIIYMNFDKAEGEITLRADGVHQIFLQDPEGHWLEINDAKK